MTVDQLVQIGIVPSDEQPVKLKKKKGWFKMTPKICPMLYQTAVDQYSNIDCIQHRCAWWVETRNTENYHEEHCAIKIIAMKNSEGRIPV